MKRPLKFVEAGRKIKEIFDLLRNKNVIGFRLEAKVWHLDSDKPLIVRMNGKRASDGGWGMQSVKEENPHTPKSAEALRSKLISIDERISKYIRQHGLDAEWKELMGSLEDALKSGRSLEDLEFGTELGFRAALGYGYDAPFYAPFWRVLVR